MRNNQSVVVDIPEINKVAYREAVVNSIVHRDYFINGEVAIEKWKDRLMINNPGNSLVKKENFGLESRPRNKLIADLLFRTKYMEKIRTGIKRIGNFSERNGNRVEFKFQNSFIVYIFGREDSLGKEKGINERILAPQVTPQVTPQVNLTDLENKIISEIQKNRKISRNKLADILEISSDTVKEYLDRLKEKRILERVGKTSAGYWEIKE